MIVEVVLDGERLEELHGGLGADLGHAVEEEDLLLGVAGVVELVGVELKRDVDEIIFQFKVEKGKGVIME